MAAIGLLLVLSIAGCGQGSEPAVATPGHLESPAPKVTPTLEPALIEPTITARLSADEAATLSSLERLDDYPLYTMRYVGTFARAGLSLKERAHSAPAENSAWACSLWAALGDQEAELYGRNFDWQFSPALLLFTDPPDGYASVSMVDITYLGFDGPDARRLDTLPFGERVALLDAPWVPFDGMNEYGLAVGMAAVPDGNVPPDPARETIGSLGVIREVLDHARNVNEAREILESYNVDMGGGPPVHYLVADRTGRALLLEFYDGALHVIANETPWHQATNFLRASVDGDARGQCWRYDELARRLSVAGGRLAVPDALDLLSDVSQDNTQWSVVYGLQSGQIDVVMGRAYERLHTLMLDMAGE